MSLQEEIATMFDGAYQAGKDGVTPPKGSEFAAKESATIVFNKVLDAVIDTADALIDPGGDIAYYKLKREINKLRPES